jgi:hypothetical protein
MSYVKMGGLAVLLFTMSLAAAETTEDKITAQPINYAGLGKLVRSYRGKVIVVDLWSID